MKPLSERTYSGIFVLVLWAGSAYASPPIPPIISNPPFVITTTSVLTQDVTCQAATPIPCIAFGASNITLDLATYKISLGSVNPLGTVGVGSCKASPVNPTCPPVLTGITIKATGGSIEGFESAIAFGRYFLPSANDVTIEDVHFKNNGTAIRADTGSCYRIIGNTIQAPGGTGINLSRIIDAKIKRNTITGLSGDGMLLSQVNFGSPAAIIIHNHVTNNGGGLFADASRLAIRCNTFSHNSGGGMYVVAGTYTIEGNQVNHNGGNGIGIGPVITSLVQDNTANDNTGNGITIPFYADNVTVLDNVAKRNAVDLFWTGVGTGNCWRFNNVITSTAALPVCAVCVVACQ